MAPWCEASALDNWELLEIYDKFFLKENYQISLSSVHLISTLPKPNSVM